MSWFFNADYESFLFSGKSGYEFISNKINQEFEYLVHFLEEDPIFTTKKYDDQFIKKIEALSGKKFFTDTNPSLARPWFCQINDDKTDRLLHSKATSVQIVLEAGLEDEAKIVSADSFNPKLNFLYKMPGELSGRGHFTWPEDDAKIKGLLKRGELLIEEPLRDRVEDFSALVLSDNQTVIYKNLVDRRFQYKGSVLTEPSLSEKEREDYLAALDLVKKRYFDLGASAPFSVDSYLYTYQGKRKLCPVCEVNPRKTMGYIALRLKEFFKASHFGMLVLPSKIDEVKISGVSFLDPAGNKFQMALIQADTEGELMSIIDRLGRLS